MNTYTYTKVHIVKAMVFPVVMYGCESWTIKKAEHRRIDSFELWCWRRLLRLPWTARRSNQSVLKETNPEHSLKGLSWNWSSNTLATWYEELTLWKRPWCWERLKAGGEGDNRGWDGWMASPIQWTWVWASSGRSWRTGKPGMLQSMGSQRIRLDWVSWTMTTTFLSIHTDWHQIYIYVFNINMLLVLICLHVCLCVCVWKMLNLPISDNRRFRMLLEI